MEKCWFIWKWLRYSKSLIASLLKTWRLRQLIQTVATGVNLGMTNVVHRNLCLVLFFPCMAVFFSVPWCPPVSWMVPPSHLHQLQQRLPQVPSWHEGQVRRYSCTPLSLNPSWTSVFNRSTLSMWLFREPGVLREASLASGVVPQRRRSLPAGAQRARERGLPVPETPV